MSHSRYVQVGTVRFRSLQATKACERLWKEFYRRLMAADGDPDDVCRGAVWVLHLPSASFKVWPAMDGDVPNDPNWEPLYALSFRVQGLRNPINEAVFSDRMDEQYGVLMGEFRDWLCHAIVTSWDNLAIQTLHSDARTNIASSFRIAWTPNDDILDLDEMAILKQTEAIRRISQGVPKTAAKKRRPSS